jgi:hypothetical protein
MDNSSIDRVTFLKNKQTLHPGQSPDKEIKDLKLKLVFWGYVVVFEFLVFFVLWEWLQWYYRTPPQPIYYTILFVIPAYLCLIRIFFVGKHIQYDRLISEGEKIVEAETEELLKYECKIFQEIVGGNINIDHIVLSPTGIYVIETEARNKKRKRQGDVPREQSKYEVVFDGRMVTIKGGQPDSEPVQRALRKAEWVQNLLKVKLGKELPVTSILVYPTWSVEESTNYERIWVLNPEYLKLRIPQRQGPNKLSPDEIQHISSELIWFARKPV